MYVCVCKGVTCNAIRAAVQAEGVASLRDLRRNLGVATQCGKCANSARQILNEALDACTDTCGRSADVAA